MSIERKFLRVSRDDEHNVIEEYSWFGWNLVSSQDVYSESVDIQYDLVMQPWLVTSTVDYAKIILERDTTHPHIEELRELEIQYFADMNMYIDYYGTKFGAARVVIVFLLVLCGMSMFADLNPIYSLMFFVPAILIVVFRIKKIKKNNYISEQGLIRARDAMEKAKSLL